MDAGAFAGREAPYDLVKTMRASVLVLGPLVASLRPGAGEPARRVRHRCAAHRPAPARGLEAMGAEVRLEHGYVDVRARACGAARIVLDIPTVTGTENLMMAASLADGTTVIENAAREPEVEDLAECLSVHGRAHPREPVRRWWRSTGVEALRPYDHTADPGPHRDRNLPRRRRPVRRGRAAGRRRGSTTSTPWWRSFGRRARRWWTWGGRGPRRGRRAPARSVDVRTSPYPGFPTDMQAQFMALMASGRGN